MPRKIGGYLLGIGLTAIMNVPAHASPACVKDPAPLMLKHDFVYWTMSAPPGFECIQGLRWSYMRIDGIVALTPPTRGKLVFVGYGFRYLANAEGNDPDSFVLMISGKNRHDSGVTILEVAVNPTEPAKPTGPAKPAGTEVSDLRLSLD